jgi:hypothetical protein
MPKLPPYNEHMQRLFCLLFVLYEMPIGGPRKREVIEYVQRRGYLELKPKDVEPYITQVEPRWNTDLAYRRKDAVQRDLLFNATRDCWELTRPGREKIETVLQDAKTRVFDVRRCPLWTRFLKRAVDPSYVPSDDDAQRAPKRGDPDYYS